MNNNRFYESFKNLKKISNCEVCGNDELHQVLDLGLHPMCDDLVKVGDKRISNKYPIEILYCKNCFTAHQHYQIPKHELFPKSYHYRARFTSDVLNGMKDLVDSCENKYGNLKDKKILDIGCNDGSLLDFFNLKGAKTFGIEPTGAFLDAKEKGHKVYNDYLSIKTCNQIVNDYGKPNIITFTNVFAHIEDLNDVLNCLKVLMSNKTLLIIENHYLGSVLDGNQFDTFYHEHPRTYSYKSFLEISKSIGFKLLKVQFPIRYGGNIRVFIGNGKEPDVDKDLINKESEFFMKFKSMNENIDRWKIKKQKELNKINSKFGKISAKAFPGRSAILIKLLNLHEKNISKVFEKPGSMKIGYYVPGTRIPILSDDDFNLNEKKPILNLAWHISDEIKKYLKKNGFKGEIIDIINSNDF